MLLKHGADVDAVDDQGNTPLHEAAGQGMPVSMGSGDPDLAEVMDTLLRHGADPRLRNDDGQTPLELARARGDRAVVLYLERRLGVR
jgi:ankyrin repeat protein